MSDSRPVRFFRLSAAAAVLLAAVLAGCGADEDTPSASASPSESASESATVSPSDTASPSPSKPASKSPSPAQTESEPAGPVLEVRVTGDEVTPVAEQFDLAPGDPLVVRVRADRAGEFHVHSDPEQFLQFRKGSVELEVTFENPGSVDIEEHETGAVVARVLVR